VVVLVTNITPMKRDIIAFLNKSSRAEGAAAFCTTEIIADNLCLR